VIEARPFEISRHVVWEAYLKVKANRGTAGIDAQSIEDFEKDLKGNLYKIWNRMASGSYFPPPVRLVEIPKKKGGTRPLGIPTVADRIAQTVVKDYLEPVVEPKFHEDSYGYRPRRSALDAVGVARQRCWQQEWVVDLDIKGFFDNLDHALVMKAVRFHTDLRWIHLYVERWLKAPVQLPDGTLRDRPKGSPQGGVVSPLIANLFMHHAFDDWMARHHAHIRFERYADDVIVHCASKQQALFVLQQIRERLLECGLELHPEKTKVVCCRERGRESAEHKSTFDFLGYTFRPRPAKNRRGEFFTSFLPAVGTSALKAFRDKIRAMQLPRKWVGASLSDLAEVLNPMIRGWAHYFGAFYRSECVAALRYLNETILRWASAKYKGLRRRPARARQWLAAISRRDPRLFRHWVVGAKPNGWTGRAG
jgi:RNA-directed DNA polymerase